MVELKVVSDSCNIADTIDDAINVLSNYIQDQLVIPKDYSFGQILNGAHERDAEGLRKLSDLLRKLQDAKYNQL